MDSWSVQPVAPPPSPSEYFKILITAAGHPITSGSAGQSGVTALLAAGLVDPYERYLADHTKYVTYMNELKYKLSCEATFDKAVKSAMAFDLKATAASLQKTSGRKDIRMKRMKPATRIEPICDAYLVYKPRTKIAPPAPKPEIVKAKADLRAAKATAKAGKITALAEKVTKSQQVQASRVRANLTYAEALVGTRAANAPAAAALTAEMVHARAFLRKERVESKRVPLYQNKGGNAAMPDAPSGDFLVQRDETSRVRVKRVSTKQNADVSTVMTETFTKD